jgi:GntR family transcriptional repressor for pyruvate dehydrogenase complex
MNMVVTWPKPTVQALPDQIGHTILQRIALGELRPGQRLPSQRHLAQSLGVGLAVVREAVQRLEALNVLETSHGRGTMVLPFRWIPLIYDPSLFLIAVQRIGVRDLWETRRLIEGQIARLAAERASETNLSAMREVLLQADPLPATYRESRILNREFHLAIAAAAQNSALQDLLAPLLDVEFEGAERRFTKKHCHDAWRAHWRIYKAIAAHDVGLAYRAIEHHFQVGPIALNDPLSRQAHSTHPKHVRRSSVNASI